VRGVHEGGLLSRWSNKQIPICTASRLFSLHSSVALPTPVMADSRGSEWPPIAAVEKPGSCREGQLTGTDANSHYRLGSTAEPPYHFLPSYASNSVDRSDPTLKIRF